MNQIRSVCQSIAYGIYDSVKSFGTLGTQDMFERNLIVETIHALNRSTPFRYSLIPNRLVDEAVSYTQNWLIFYRLEAQELFNVPQWGEEFNPTKKV